MKTIQMIIAERIAAKGAQVDPRHVHAGLLLAYGTANGCWVHQIDLEIDVMVELMAQGEIAQIESTARSYGL